jgi:hypothetical protein
MKPLRSVPLRGQFLQNEPNVTANESELVVDAVEPLVDHFETRVNGDELGLKRTEPCIDGLETPVNGFEALILRCKAQVHLGKASINQLRMLAKMLCEGFASHRSFDNCHAFVE